MTYQHTEQLTPQEAGFYQAVLREFPRRAARPTLHGSRRKRPATGSTRSTRSPVSSSTT